MHPVDSPNETGVVLSHRHTVPPFDPSVQLDAPFQSLYTGLAEEISNAEAAADLQGYREQRET
jgi:hypothetical protein